MEEKERYIIDRFDEDIFDTKKEYYPSNQTILEIINKQDKRIKELEEENQQLKQQLAESESKRKSLEEKIKFLTEETEENFVDGQKYNQLVEKLEQLKEELIEKKDLERALSACNRQNDEFADMIKKLVSEKEELKKQLEEKEKLLQYGMTEIKKLHKRINDIVKRDEKLFKSQPAEIVEKIKKQIFNHFNVKNMEEYENLSLIDSLFTADAVIEMLDTILKEYQK